MSDFVALEIAGEIVHLHADRAIFWPRENALLIADLHLGKADTFRSAGIPLPSGGTRHDLLRLSRLFEKTRADRLIVLGDMLHSTANERSWRATWDEWRSERNDVRIDVIAGNHDRNLNNVSLDVRVHASRLLLEPFDLRHAPSNTSAHVICGHVHPVVRIGNLAKRWPAFVLHDTHTIIPAFSAFTGGSLISAKDTRIAVCNGDAIVAMDARLSMS